MIYELHLVKLGPIRVTGVGQNAELVDQDQDIRISKERNLFIDFGGEGSEIVVGHHVWLDQAEGCWFNLGWHVGGESVRDGKR